MKIIILIYFVLSTSICFSQEFSLQELHTIALTVNYKDGGYEYFETEANKRGFEFYKVLDIPLEDQKNIKSYYFQKKVGTNNWIESISYNLSLIKWRPNFKEVEISYSTYSLDNFNKIKDQLKLNGFKISQTQDIDDGYVIVNHYDKHEFSFFITTTQARDKDTTIISYSIEISRKPLFSGRQLLTK